MEMENRLPGIRPRVDHQAVTILAHIVLLRQLARDKKHMRKQASIFFANTVEGGDMFIGDNEQVNRRSGALVPKDSYLAILEYYGSSRLPGDNLAKDTILRHILGRVNYTRCDCVAGIDNF